MSQAERKHRAAHAAFSEHACPARSFFWTRYAGKIKKEVRPSGRTTFFEEGRGDPFPVTHPRTITLRLHLSPLYFPQIDKGR